MPLDPAESRDTIPGGDAASRETLAWLLRAVVGLNLCPFAKAPLVRQQVRFVVCESDDPRVLLDALCAEMTALAAADPAVVETTLLIHPNALLDFDDFNDFLGAAEAALDDLGLDGVLQVASFHPQYRFAGAAADDIGNATNRSPHPTLHLLRESSVARAVEAFPDAEAIFGANIATLEALGKAGWAAMMAQCRAEAIAQPITEAEGVGLDRPTAGLAVDVVVDAVADDVADARTEIASGNSAQAGEPFSRPPRRSLPAA